MTPSGTDKHVTFKYVGTDGTSTVTIGDVTVPSPSIKFNDTDIDSPAWSVPYYATYISMPNCSALSPNPSEYTQLNVPT